MAAREVGSGSGFTRPLVVVHVPNPRSRAASHAPTRAHAVSETACPQWIGTTAIGVTACARSPSAT